MPIIIKIVAPHPILKGIFPPSNGGKIPIAVNGGGEMYACPKCGSTNLRFTYVSEEDKREVKWTCTYCKQWEGQNPIRRDDSHLAPGLEGKRMKRSDITPAIRSLQESGDLVIVDLGDEEVEIVPVVSSNAGR